MAIPIEERARRWIAKMPAAVSGQGGHAATFHVACVLVQGFGLTPEQAMPLMLEYNEQCLPKWTDRDLRHKLNGANRAPGLRRKDGHTLPRGCLLNAIDFKPSKDFRDYHEIEPAKQPQFDLDKLKKFAGELAGDVDLLWLASRSMADPCAVNANDYLSRLYRPNEKVIVFTNIKSQGQAVWPNETLPESGKNGVWFLAQPVDGEYHPNPRTGNMSRRSEEAVQSWRYLLIESDDAPLVLWLAALVQMPLRIASIVSSGGRSVHALVQVDARTKEEWDKEARSMKNALVSLGADPQAMTAVKQPRLPGCYREGKIVRWKDKNDGTERERYVRFTQPRLQKLLYLNPEPPMRPICELTPGRDVLKPWLEWASLGIADSDETNGQALTHALHYYAPVSEDCRVALQRVRAGRA